MTEPAESDAQRYTRLVSANPPTTEDLAACQGLKDDDLRGDCGLVTARGAANAAGLPPETYCAQITGTIWQAECFFMAAEDHNSDGEIEQAAALCLQAEVFTDHCAQHLWQRSLRALTWRNGSRDFTQKLPAAQRLYQRWAPLLETDTDFRVRFWRRYYEGGFERARVIDLADCAPLQDEDRRWCRTAGLSLLTRRIEEVIRIPRAAEDLCRSPPNAAALARNGPPQFNVRPDPAIDDAIAALQEAHCRDGRPISNGENLHEAPFSPAP